MAQLRRARARGPRARRAGRPRRARTAPATPRSSGASSSARLVEGELLGVVSTDALELGIDIGALDAAICVTFPGTVASLRQMWGRAGRRGRGLAVYVAGEDALDQFFCRHPDEFLDRPVEAAILDHEQRADPRRAPAVRGARGPARRDADDEYARPALARTAEALVSAGDLRERPDGTFVPRRTDEFPAADVSLRSASRDNVAIVDTGSGELLGTVDLAARAHHHPRGRGLPARRALLRGRRRSTSRAPRARARRSPATGTRSPSGRPTRTSSGCSTAARRSA